MPLKHHHYVLRQVIKYHDTDIEVRRDELKVVHSVIHRFV